MRKHIFSGIALAALFAFAGSAVAQVTGACPANQFVSVVNNNLVAQACSQPAMSNLSGTLAVSQGGTGLTAGTSGGVLGYTATGTLASSAALAANGVVIGGGAGATPTAITAGTTGQLLQGGSGAPSFATTLTGSYVFGATLVTFGNASGTPTHIATAQTTAPAVTSCGGGSPTITGTDEAGIVTMGTSATGCVITFNVAYTGAPFCVVSWIATPLASQSYATSNTAITTTQTSTSSNVLQYMCKARSGG